MKNVKQSKQIMNKDIKEKRNIKDKNEVLLSTSEIILSEEGPAEKSKKKRDSSVTSASKTNLWNVFDTEVINPEKQKDPLECLFRTITNRENCEMCQTALSYSDEGFLTCTNNKCGHHL